MTFAQGQKPTAAIQQSSQPCAPDDQSEICRLRRAVSASLDQLQTLKIQAQAAQDAITALQAQADAAKAAIEANKVEREAAQHTIAVAEKAIEQQQAIITTYESAIKTLTALVDLTMRRVDDLEKKLDKANGRTAKLGIALTALGVIAAVAKILHP
jgi:chromosome segregation ATPase